MSLFSKKDKNSKLPSDNNNNLLTSSDNYNKDKGNNNNSEDLVHSPNHPTIQKAMEGKMHTRDEFMQCLEVVRKDNGVFSEKLQIQLSKGTLEFPLCEVMDFDAEATRGWVQDTVSLAYSGKHSKVYVSVECLPNKKFEFQSPPIQEVKQGKSIDLQFKLRVFCTTKVYSLLKIQVFKNKPGTMTSKGDSGGAELGHFYLSFKVESTLSHIIDYDEIRMGPALGKGGYGTVYQGFWRETEVAVKVLNLVDVFTEAELDVVKREIRLMNKLAHQHIVTYMGSTQVPGQPLTIIMELVKGGSLTQLLAARPLSDHFRAKLCLDVAKGMQYLHNGNVYHRDIKPDNMLVVSPNEEAWVNIKITDFGTSKASIRTQSSDYDTLEAKPGIKPNIAPRKTDSGPGVGTLIYSAPEVFGSGDYPIAKTDVFSFGMSVYQIFTGKEPFSDAPYNSWSRFAVRKFVTDGNRLEIPSNLHPSVSALIRKCWDHNPAARPDFNTIAGELESIIKQLQEKHLQNSIPVPRAGDLNSIGWSGEISRPGAEVKLSNKPIATFLVRYSKNTMSYVLSYVQPVKDPSKDSPYQHIGFIRPIADGSVSVDREDKSQQFYGSIFEYIEAMKKSGIIKEPYVDEVESNYAASPAVYQKSPPVEHSPPSPIPVHQLPTPNTTNNNSNLSRSGSNSSTGSRK